MHWFFSVFLKRRNSGYIAKKRLKYILISDRAECSHSFIDAIKEDIGQSMSKYIEFSEEQIKIEIITNDFETEKNPKKILVVRIPFKEMNKVIC